MLTFVLGTRPEAVKVGPVVAELKALGHPPAVLLTGQHTTLLAGTPVESDLIGAKNLGLASDGNVTGWLNRVERALEARWRHDLPSGVAVQGDTMSALAAGRVGAGLGIPLVHIEAGIRSHNRQNPWPEEGIRVELSKLAKWHLAPTWTAFDNLVAEGYDENAITVTGNTVVSSMARYAPSVRPVPLGRPVVMITLHRREIQQADTIGALYDALRLAASERPHLQFLWPLHPAVERLLVRGIEPENLLLGLPVPHPQFLQLTAHASLLLTDSGGAVEEAATLGVPTAILRATNDRPEAEAAGIARRFDPIPTGVFAALDWFPSVVRRPSAVFGSVDAAANVARFLKEIV